MPLTPQQIQQSILRQFRDANVSGIEGADGRVYGEFTWKGFKGVPVSKRLAVFREKVREPLGVEGVYLGTVVPLAEGEKAL